jgi:hypothetical protein
MLTAATAATIRAADRRSTPTELQIGRKGPQLTSVPSDIGRFGMLAVRLPFPKGTISVILYPKRGWMALLSGECCAGACTKTASRGFCEH